MGKAIYTPKGKASEFSKYAVNFYNGCSADCDYCYCKSGVLKNVWSNKPTLKKTLINPETALKIFFKEMKANLSSLREYGLFFNFTSDPFLKETIELNLKAMRECEDLGIPVIALTKQTWWSRNGSPSLDFNMCQIPSNVNMGFTLTGHDELEKGAATNQERIEAMGYFAVAKNTSHAGNKIWASIEPVIDIKSSIKMIKETLEFVDHYKIGTLSGAKYDKDDLSNFVHAMAPVITGYATVYFKDEILKQAGISREFLNSYWSGCVDRDYRWWL